MIVRLILITLLKCIKYCRVQCTLKFMRKVSFQEIILLPEVCAHVMYRKTRISQIKVFMSSVYSQPIIFSTKHLCVKCKSPVLSAGVEGIRHRDAPQSIIEVNH